MNAEQLAIALRFVMPITEKKTTIPILKCALLRGGRLMATNLSSTISIPVPHTKDIDTCIPVDPATRMLLAVGHECRCYIEEDRLYAMAQNTSGSIALVSPKEFPKVKFPKIKLHPYNRSHLQVVYAMGNRTSVEYNQALTFRDGLVLATDGKRLAVAETGLDLPSFAISDNDLTSLNSSLLGYENGQVATATKKSGKKGLISASTAELPDVQAIIDRKIETELFVDLGKFKNALKTVAAFCEDQILHVPIVDLEMGDKGLRIWSDNAYGTITRTIEAKATKPLRARFNRRYLQDVLRDGTEQIWCSQHKGMVTKKPGETHIVMPMALPAQHQNHEEE